MALTNGHHYRFDTFEIDPDNRTLTRDGHDIHVTGRVFDILLAFVENPGRLLEKDELIEKVWHHDVVEDSNLTRNVSTLRKTLGDTARDHKYIITVQGHGYRFVADVTEVQPAEDRPPIPHQAPRPAKEYPSAVSGIRLYNKWLWVIPMAVLLIVAIWAAER